MASCIFCNLVKTGADMHVLREGHAAAFLDIRPLFFGHVLVVPTDHVETLTDLPDARVGPFFVTVKRVARAVESALDAKGTFVAMNNKISQSVPHLHVHVVPRNPKDGLRGFFWPRAKYATEAEAAAIATKIRDALAASAQID